MHYLLRYDRSKYIQQIQIESALGIALDLSDDRPRKVLEIPGTATVTALFHATLDWLDWGENEGEYQYLILEFAFVAHSLLKS